MGIRDTYERPPARRPVEDRRVSRRGLLRIPRSRSAAADVDWEEAERRVAAGWCVADHSELMRLLEPAAELLVRHSSVEAGERVLDVGAGDGNVALAAAGRGALVSAYDPCERMVARGRDRSGPTVRWGVSSATALPCGDDSYDAVLSAFGAAQAPRALRAARELARVTRPGGRVGLAAWVPRGLPGRLDELVDEVRPLPVGVTLPSAWGGEQVACERLSEAGLESIQVRTRTISMRWASAAECFATLAAPYGLDDHARAVMRPRFDQLLASCNNRPPGVELRARVLVVMATKPA